jgi:hypothetical protein
MTWLNDTFMSRQKFVLNAKEFGVYIHFCGHYLHFDCYDKYYNSLRQRRNQLLFEGSNRILIIILFHFVGIVFAASTFSLFHSFILSLSLSLSFSLSLTHSLSLSITCIHILLFSFELI